MNDAQPAAPATPFAAQLDAARERAKLKLGGVKHRADELHEAGDGWGLLDLFFGEKRELIKAANDEYHFAHWLAERGIRPPVDNDDWAALALFAGVPGERDPAKIARAAMARRHELPAAVPIAPPAAEPVSAPEVPVAPPAALLLSLTPRGQQLVACLWSGAEVSRTEVWEAVFERSGKPNANTINGAVTEANRALVNWQSKHGGPLYHISKPKNSLKLTVS